MAVRGASVARLIGCDTRGVYVERLRSRDRRTKYTDSAPDASHSPADGQPDAAPAFFAAILPRYAVKR